MDDNKSTCLNLDKNNGNGPQIELVDNSDIRTIKTIDTKASLKLTRRGVAGASAGEASRAAQSNYAKSINHDDMIKDLELMGNDDVKHQVAELVDGFTPPTTKREMKSQPVSSSNGFNSSKNEPKTSSRPKLDINSETISLPRLPSPSRRNQNKITAESLRDERNQINAVNHRLNYITDKCDADVRSNTSTKIMNFSPKLKKSNDEFGFAGDNFSLGEQQQQQQQRHSPDPPIKKLSSKELHLQKIKTLLKIERLKRRGYTTQRHFTITDSIDELTAEHTRMEEHANLEAGIENQKNALILFSSFLQMANSNYNNVVEFNLDGWSDSLHDNIDKFEPVFEELYDKYKDTVQMAPEFKLVLMFFGSAVSYHFSQQILKKAEKSMPGFGAVMDRNPALKKSYTDAAANLFVNNMAGNNRNNNQSENGPATGGGFNDILGGLGSLMGGGDGGGMAGLLSGFGGGSRPAQVRPRVGTTTFANAPQNAANPSGEGNRVQLKEPAGFDDLLKDINMGGHMTETSLKIDDDLTSYATNNNTLRNVHLGNSNKRAVRKVTPS